MSPDQALGDNRSSNDQSDETVQQPTTLQTKDVCHFDASSTIKRRKLSASGLSAREFNACGSSQETPSDQQPGNSASSDPQGRVALPSFPQSESNDSDEVSSYKISCSSEPD